MKLIKKNLTPRPALFLFFFIVLFIFAGNDYADIKSKNIHYSNINNHTNIIGSLGKPLGEIITVEGSFSKKNSRAKADSEMIFLKINNINNKKVNNPILIPFNVFAWVNTNKPVLNNKFKYIGYETGEMKGIPEKAFNYMPHASTEGYHFHVYFQVCKELKI